MTNHHRIRRAVMAAPLAAWLLVPAAATQAAPEATAPIPSAQKSDPAAELRRQEIELRNAVRANPSDPTAHIKLARIYIKLGNFPAAEAETREARRNGGDEDDTAPLLAEVLLSQGKLTQLMEQIKPADRQPAAESMVRLSLGSAHLALREITVGEPLLRDAVRLDPESWRARVALGRFLLLTGKVAEASAQLEAGRTVAPDNIEVRRLGGEILRAKGDNNGALVEFGKVLAARPTDVAALIDRTNVFVDENKLSEAQHDIEAALKITPKSTQAIYLNALVLARQGKISEADAKLTSIATSFETLRAGYYLQGAVKFALGQYEQADGSLSKFLSRQPNQSGATRLRAEIALRRNDPARAIELLKPVLDAKPSDRATATVLARAYVAAGRTDQALELFEKAAEAQPDDVKAQTAAAVMRISYGDQAQGLNQLEKLTATEQGADLAAPLLVLAELRRGDVPKAALIAEDLAKRNPNDPIILNLLGSVRMAQERLPDAEVVFRDITKKMPNFLAARRNLAQVLYGEKKPDEAKAVLVELLQKTPNDERTLLTLAQMAFTQKNYAETAEQLKAAQKAAPKDPMPSIRLVQLYAMQKDWTKASDALRAAEGTFPDDARIVDLAVGLRTDQGDPSGAALKYRPLVERNPQSAPIIARYAALQSRAGDTDGARISLARAVSLAPQDATLAQELVSFDYATKGPDEALATARSFAKTDAQLARLLSADVLARANRTAEAMAELTALQRESPSGPAAARLAALLYKTGKRDDAKAMLQSWIKQHDDDVRTRVTLADILMQEHDDAGAQGLYEQAHQRAPNDVVALNNLALLYAKKKDQRAPELAAAAYRIAPRPEIADTLGWSLISRGKAVEALPYLRDAGAALPQNASVQYHLAVALEATGSKDEARSLLEKLVKSPVAFDEKSDAQRLLDTLQHG